MCAKSAALSVTYVFISQGDVSSSVVLYDRWETAHGVELMRWQHAWLSIRTESTLHRESTYCSGLLRQTTASVSFHCQAAWPSPSPHKRQRAEPTGSQDQQSTHCDEQPLPPGQIAPLPAVCPVEEAVAAVKLRREVHLAAAAGVLGCADVALLRTLLVEETAPLVGHCAESAAALAG